MATSGTWSSKTLYNITARGEWSASVTRSGTSSTATVTLSATIISDVGYGNNCGYYMYTDDTTCVASDTSTHYEGTSTTLTYSYSKTVGDGSGTISDSFTIWFKFPDGTWATFGTASYSVSYGAKTSYTVTYNANNGSGAPAKQTKYYGTDLTLSTTKPTRTGYTFQGWATSSSGSVKYAAGAKYTANASATLYAVWKSNTTYTVTYNANGGTGSVSSQSGYSGTSVTISGGSAMSKATASSTVTITYNKVEDDATVSRESDSVTYSVSYSFASWNTKADGSGTKYAAGDKLTLSANVTLYAQYTSRELWDCSETALPTGTLDQMTLSGWSKTEGGSELAEWPLNPVSDITLYAIWAADGNGGFLRFTQYAASDPVYEVGSTVRLVGLKDSDNDGVYTIASASVTAMNDENNAYLVKLSFEENFTVSGMQDGSERTLEIWGSGSYVPDMDFICSKDNRLWGCSNKTRTIYASALGDPTDFWTFENTTLDAYQVAVASAGKFTGMVALNSSVIIMKQHTLHKMLGSYPSEYTLYTYNLDGVLEGNSGSLQNCEGTALYVSEHGILSYSGSDTGTLSVELGNAPKADSVASFNGQKYALYFKDADGNGKTYVYDTRYGMWIQEDYGEVLAFAHLDTDDYVLSRENNVNTIYRISTEEDLDDDWEIVYKPYIETYSTSKTTTHYFEKKRYTGLTIRMELPKGSWIKAEAKYDGKGSWHQLATRKGTVDGVCDFVVSTPRVDKLQLRLSGHGPMTILAMERQYLLLSRR